MFTNPVPPNQIFNQLNIQTIHAWFIDSFSNLCGQIRLLLSGDSNYVRSAIACINRDYAYFFKVFKKRMGMTPKNYISNLNIT